MNTPHRNQLVWLSEAGWHRVLSCAWDAQAGGILRHWRTAQLPWVVCTRRSQAGEAISLGLPAPAVWGRRKLSMEALPQEVVRVGCFPTAEQLARGIDRKGKGKGNGNDEAWKVTLKALQALQLDVQVYGSVGWQHLTGLRYVRASSDIDVRVEVADHAVAVHAARALAEVSAPMRLDGELAFPDGSAIAWREYLQWLDGKVDSVMVKRRAGVQLISGDALAEWSPCVAV